MGNKNTVLDDHPSDRDWKAASRSFDTVAELYDVYRPGYPPELIESILSVLPPRARILEVGSGTGKATTPFARRGFSILCIEPGQNLAAVAKHNLRGLDVTFEPTRFEDWNELPNAFDLVMSAQAWHWVSKEVSYPKAARVLKENGGLALFWNWYPGLEGRILEELEEVYLARAPEIAGPPEPIEQTIRRTEEEIQASGRFGNLQVRRFHWSVRYTTEQYLGLLNTYSDHIGLAEDVRSNLLESIARVIERHGGYLDKPYLAVLYLTRKRSSDG